LKLCAMTDFAFEELFSDGSDTQQPIEDADNDHEELIGDEPSTKKSKTFEDFDILKHIGEGAYGKVYQVQCRESDRIYAMKVLKKHHLLKTNSVGYTITERDILRKMKHPFIIQLHNTFQSQERVGFVMDYVSGGQLFFHLRREAILSESVARFYCAELILALEHLHANHVIHRDLKPENILISATGHVILTDFGLAKEQVETDDGASTFCGTMEYMAPEMIKGEKYGKSADFWSVGVLLYDMLKGNPPFRNKNKKKLQDEICSKKIAMSSYWQKDTHSIIRGLTMKDPSQRLKLAEIKAHPFFSSINWQHLLEKNTVPPFVPATPKGDLDVSNFDEAYINKPISWSIGPALSNSQEDQFKGFSFSRSFTPPLNTPFAVATASVDVSSIKKEISAELMSLSRDNAAERNFSLASAFDDCPV